MAQLHCYVPDDVARQAQNKAEQAGMSLSRYLAELIKRDANADWPAGYFDILGTWQGEPLERPPSMPAEARLELK